MQPDNPDFTVSPIPVFRAVADVLDRLGAKHLFGLLGDGNFRFAVAARERGIVYHGARHENASIAMADTFARIARTVGVATVTTGPGLTNACAGLEEAVRARTPLVVLAGAVGNSQADHQQLLDQDGVMRALGCGVQRYRGPAHVVEDLTTAFRRAIAERRPIVFSIPGDEQEAPTIPAPESRMPSVPRAHPAPDTTMDVRELILQSERPVIIAGQGAYSSDAEEALRRLGDRIGALMCTTAVTKGLFADDPFLAGVSGGFAPEGIARLLEKADLVLAFGASLNKWTTRTGTLYANATIVQVDDRDFAFERLQRSVVPVLGDARATAEDLVAAIADDEAHPRWRTSATKEILRRYAEGDPYEDESNGRTIDPRKLTIELARRLPDRAMVVTDSGAWVGFVGSFFRPKRGGRFLFPQASQCLGLGIAHTLGAAAAAPETIGVSLIGDGGLLMSLGELETVLREGRPHLVVVYNDSAYGAEIHVARHHGLPVDIVQFPDSDFAAIATAMGGRGAVVRSIDDLAVLDDWLRAPEGLLLLDAKIDSDIPAPLWREFFRPSPAADGH